MTLDEVAKELLAAVKLEAAARAAELLCRRVRASMVAAAAAVTTSNRSRRETKVMILVVWTVLGLLCALLTSKQRTSQSPVVEIW